MKWNPKEFHDTYRDDLMKMIEEKATGHVKAGAASRRRAARGAEVIDFAKLLEKSLARRKRRAPAAANADGAPREREAHRSATTPQGARPPAPATTARAA